MTYFPPECTSCQKPKAFISVVRFRQLFPAHCTQINFCCEYKKNSVLKNISFHNPKIFNVVEVSKEECKSQTEGKNKISKRMKLVDKAHGGQTRIIYSNRFQNKVSWGDTFKTL